MARPESTSGTGLARIEMNYNHLQNDAKICLWFNSARWRAETAIHINQTLADALSINLSWSQDELQPSLYYLSGHIQPKRESPYGERRMKMIIKKILSELGISNIDLWAESAIRREHQVKWKAHDPGSWMPEAQALAFSINS